MNDVPLKLIIPLPSHYRYGVGEQSTRGKSGNLRVRCSSADYNTIKEEANRLGLTVSSFVRWCAVQAALAIAAHRDKSSESIESEVSCE